MRTLRFIVDGQIIKKDPNCDFENLVPGSCGYLKAQFTFSPDWNGFKKVAAFKSVMGKEHTPQVLAADDSCIIPEDATRKAAFKIYIVGKQHSSGEPKIMTTNDVTVSQNGALIYE